MAQVFSEQLGASKGDEREMRSAEKAGEAEAKAASGSKRGTQEREAGELDEDALDQVSGGRVSAAQY